MNYLPVLIHIIFVALWGLLVPVEAWGQTAVDVGSGYTSAGTSGTLDYARVTGQDANTFGSPEANILVLRDNNLDAVTSTCASQCSSDQMCIIDESSATSGDTDSWSLCINNAPSAFRTKGVILNHTLNQTIGNSAWTPLTFNTENLDSDAMHSTITNPTRVTIPAGMGGVYSMHCSVDFVDDTVGTRGIMITKNAATTPCADLETASGGTGVTTIACNVQIAAGDYVECQVFQSSGGDLNVVGNLPYSPIFSVIMLGS